MGKTLLIKREAVSRGNLINIKGAITKLKKVIAPKTVATKTKLIFNQTSMLRNINKHNIEKEN